MTYQQLYDKSLEILKANGTIVWDVRLNRKVLSLPVYSLYVPNDVLLELKKEEPLEKYKEDWKRMKSTFDLAVEKANEDPDSRQLLVLNTDNYKKIQQCFQLIQFHSDKNGFVAVVYQRSGDIAKLKEDLIFFSDVVSKFEVQTMVSVKHLMIFYCDFHSEISQSQAFVE